MRRVQNLFDGESLIVPAGPIGIGGFLIEPEDEAFATARINLALALGVAEQQFEAGGDPAVLVRRLGQEMHALRSRVTADVWRHLVPIAQSHAVCGYVHQDPFTGWSFRKPRGYSGDARLLDFIYGHESVAELVEAATPLGRAIFGYSGNAPAPAAVRERRDLLARHVDRIAAERGDGAEILTVAAGHLREAELASALTDGRIERWVALDQDPLCIDTITRDHAGTCVAPFDGSVRGLLTGAYDLGRFDFAYAAGLYDYLPRATAVKLTKRCLAMLKPGGTFLFANFAAGIVDDGYMETFMNWTLLLRSEAEMWDIVNSSVDRNRVEAEVRAGGNGNILYALIRKCD